MLTANPEAHGVTLHAPWDRPHHASTPSDVLARPRQWDAAEIPGGHGGGGPWGCHPEVSGEVCTGGLEQARGLGRRREGWDDAYRLLGEEAERYRNLRLSLGRKVWMEAEGSWVPACPLGFSWSQGCPVWGCQRLPATLRQPARLPHQGNIRKEQQQQVQRAITRRFRSWACRGDVRYSWPQGPRTTELLFLLLSYIAPSQSLG